MLQCAGICGVLQCVIVDSAATAFEKIEAVYTHERWLARGADSQRP